MSHDIFQNVLLRQLGHGHRQATDIRKGGEANLLFLPGGRGLVQDALLLGLVIKENLVGLGVDRPDAVDELKVLSCIDGVHGGE